MKSVLLILGTCLIVGAFDIDMYHNLALNKPAYQSSVASDISHATASKANDGNRTNVEDMSKNSCIHTAYSNNQQHKEAWWTVDLEFITRIHEVLITYRDWETLHVSSSGSLAGFSIFVSNSSDFKGGAHCFQQSGSMPNVQRTPYPCFAIGRFVTVYNNRTHSPFPDGYRNEAVLELCEVEIPGCRFQHFGQGCNKSCYCQKVTCDYKSGQCNGACQVGHVGESCNIPCNPGYYGENCSFPCPHCGGNKTCNQSGVCLDGCEAGFYTDQSPGCSQQCGHCLSIQCNHNGSCPLGCSDGYYMSDCKSTCPDKCNNRICTQTSGHCTSCVDGYFGEICDKECPQYCSQRKCEYSSGNCLACESGHYGYNCTHECLHCGGDKTCDNSGACLNGCQTGNLSDYSPGCSMKCNNCKQDMTSNMVLPVLMGVLSGVLLVVLGTIMNVVLYRRTRASIGKRAETYMQFVAGDSAEHVYNHIQPGIRVARTSLDEDLANFDHDATPQNPKPDTDVYRNTAKEVDCMKTSSTYKDYENMMI